MAEEKLNKRTQDALTAIEDAVFDLLEEKTFDSITARDIYNQAKVNKMTFYKYHSNKFDALAKAFTSRVDIEFAQRFSVEEALFEEGDYDESIYRGLIFVVEFIERYRAQFAHLVSPNGDLPRDVVFSALFSNYRIYFSAIVGGDLSKENEYLVYFLFGSFRSLYDCQMQQLAKNPKGAFPKQDAEKACHIIARSFKEVLLALRDDLKDKLLESSNQ